MDNRENDFAEGRRGLGIVRIPRANGSKPVTGRGLMRGGGTTDLKIFLRHIPLSTPFPKKLTVRKALPGSLLWGEDRCFSSFLNSILILSPLLLPFAPLSRPVLGPGFRFHNRSSLVEQRNLALVFGSRQGTLLSRPSHPCSCVLTREKGEEGDTKYFRFEFPSPRYDGARLAWLDLDRAAGRMLASLSRF